MATQTLRNEEEEDSEEEEEMELLKLEEQLKTFSERIHDYRTTFPDQLSFTISSIFASQTPVLPEIDPPGTGPSTDSLKPAESETIPLAITEGQEEAEKTKLLKQKIASNASAIPVVLNRMKECIARIDKLESSDPVIHPAFKRKRNG